MSADAKVSGDVFLKLDQDSLEHYELSIEFQTPLMKIIKEMVCGPILKIHLNNIINNCRKSTHNLQNLRHNYNYTSRSL